MMNSLFSSFDPAGSFLKTNYVVLCMVFAIPLFSKKLNLNARWTEAAQTLNVFMSKELGASIQNNNTKGKMSMLLSVFFVILMLNIMGLTPYVYTVTAQMAFTLSAAIPLWVSFILFSMVKNTNVFISHMVPLSTPMALSQFMTVIETVSQMIRPITLSVRLAANMTAGHILMALASGPLTALGVFSMVLLVLILLEMAVAIIQSYVFTILLSMYLSETT